MVKTIVLNIRDMHCTSCAMNIDGELEETEGVDEANTNYAKAQTQVMFDDAKLSTKQIVSIIKTAGYTAEPVMH